MSSILIENASLIATMDDDRTKIRNGHVYIENGKIIEVGGGKIERNADKIIDATGEVVLPGFVNTHHHLYQTLTRNIPQVQNCKLFDWLIGLYEIWGNLTPEAVYVSTQVGIGELFLSGCTTTSDHFYLFPGGKSANLIDEEIKAAGEMGMRFHPCRGSMSRGKSEGGLPPDDVIQPETEILKDSERLIKEYHDPAGFSMCRMVLAPCSPFSVTTDLMAKSIELARDAGVQCHTHLAEMIEDEEYCLEVYGKRPVDYLESIGWLGPDVWLAHCVLLNEEEINKLADTGTGVSHCPTSNMRLGSGIAPVKNMIDTGVAVSLGVDGSASNDSSNMLAEIRQALLVHRLDGDPVNWLTAEEVLWMATRGGAKVLGRDDIGSIQANKAADITIIDLNQLGYAGAMSDPLAAIVFCNSNQPVDTTIVNGRIVVENGALVGVDVDKLIQTANEISEVMLRS